MRRAAKVDANHGVIVEAFRAQGCGVQSLAATGDGVPDLLVGLGNRNHLVEVKDGSKPPSQRRLTSAQVEWHARWPSKVWVVESVLEAVSLVALWRREVGVMQSDVEVDPSDWERPRREVRITPSVVRKAGGA